MCAKWARHSSSSTIRSNYKHACPALSHPVLYTMHACLLVAFPVELGGGDGRPSH